MNNGDIVIAGQSDETVRAWSEIIVEYYRKYMLLDGGDCETVEIDGAEYTDADEIRELVLESALSVEVRDGWHVPGAEPRAEPVEYRVCLTTGGPGVQLAGSLSQYCQPESWRMEMRDWFIPWERFDNAEYVDYDAAIEWFAGCFWFGE